MRRSHSALDSLEHLAGWFVLTYGVLQSHLWRLAEPHEGGLVIGDLDRAEAYARRAVAHAPTAPGAREDLGQVLVERGDISGAAAAYMEAARYGPPATERALFVRGSYRRLRVGPYRVLYEVEGNLITIVRIDRV